jgi:hypothetical protein
MPNTALQSLLREGPLTADCALSWDICGPLICAIYSLHHTSAELRAVSEVYAADDGDAKFVNNSGWTSLTLSFRRWPCLSVACPGITGAL